MATLLSDNFDRANSTTVIGAPQIGPTPTVLAGVGGISTNRLYAPTPTLLAVYELGTTDVEIEMQAVGTAASRVAGILLGAASTTDFYLVHFDYDGVKLYRQGPGGLSIWYRVQPAPVPGTLSTCKASYKGGVIRAYLNGTQVARWLTDAPITSTRHGVRINDATGIRVDSLLAVDAPTITDAEPPAELAPEVAQEGGDDAVMVYRGRDTKALDLAGVS